MTILSIKAHSLSSAYCQLIAGEELYYCSPGCNEVVLADQLKNLDWSIRSMSFVEKAPYGVIEQTQEFIESLLKE